MERYGIHKTLGGICTGPEQPMAVPKSWNLQMQTGNPRSRIGKGKSQHAGSKKPITSYSWRLTTVGNRTENHYPSLCSMPHRHNGGYRFWKRMLGAAELTYTRILTGTECTGEKWLVIKNRKCGYHTVNKAFPGTMERQSASTGSLWEFSYTSEDRPQNTKTPSIWQSTPKQNHKMR